MNKFLNVSLATAMTLVLALTASAQTISVNFQGRDGLNTGNPATTGLTTAEAAGVVAVGNWNNVDDAYNTDGTITGFTANNGTTAPLMNSAGAATAVTLTFVANDSWYNDVDPATATTPNAKMMNGVMKRQGAGTDMVLTFNNVADAQYDIYVYTDSNNTGVALDVSDGGFLTTYYVTAYHQFVNTDVFVQGLNTNPAGPRDLCNYVKLSAVPTFGATKLTVRAKYRSGGDGLGVAGVQIVNVGGPVVNTTHPVAFSSQPISRRVAPGGKVTFTVTATGPNPKYQWFKGITSLPGETSNTYTTPAVTAANNGDAYHVVLSNEVNSVPSSDGVVTVGSLVPAVGFANSDVWDGLVRADIETPGFSTPPTRNFTLSAIDRSSPNLGNDYAERVTATFTAPATADYVFYVAVDDDADFFISSDSNPANKVLVASEPAWNPVRYWIGDTRRAGSGANENQTDTSGLVPATAPWNGKIHLTQGNPYYIELDHHQGTGGDNIGVTYKLSTDPDPKNGDPSRLTGSVISTPALDGGVIAIGTQPANALVLQNQTATFTVAATAKYAGDDSTSAPPINYKWQVAAAGSSTFADIPNAAGTSFTTPAQTLADTGKQYRAVVTVPGSSVNSSVALLTVNADNIPPTLVSAASFSASKSVGIAFSEAIDPVSGGVAGNYTIAGATVTAAKVRTSDPSTVSLTLAAPLAGTSFTVVVTGVKDLPGNTIVAGSSVVGKVVSLISEDIGDVTVPDPAQPGDAFAVSDAGFDITASGSDIWNSGDGMRFTYYKKTNDFDVKVRIVSVVAVNSWSAGALMVRPSLTFNDRQWHIKETPLTTAATVEGGSGAGTIESNRRDSVGGATAGWAGNTAGTQQPPKYPNAWIRLSRTGTVFHAYTGTNGTDWVEVATEDPATTGDSIPYPAEVFVGLATTAHHNAPATDGINGGDVATEAPDPKWLTIVQYRDFGDFVTGGPTPTITSARKADGTGVTLTFTGTLLSSDKAEGPYTPVAGATSPRDVLFSTGATKFYETK